MYCIYYFDEGEYSRPMSWLEAKKTAGQFPCCEIVSLRTGEVVS